MVDMDKFNIDSIIVRLFEGKFWLLDMLNNFLSSFFGWKRWKIVVIIYVVLKIVGKILFFLKY